MEGEMSDRRTFHAATWVVFWAGAALALMNSVTAVLAFNAVIWLYIGFVLAYPWSPFGGVG
jgi:hypothetical protein